MYVPGVMRSSGSSDCFWEPCWLPKLTLLALEPFSLTVNLLTKESLEHVFCSTWTYVTHLGLWLVIYIKKKTWTEWTWFLWVMFFRAGLASTWNKAPGRARRGLHRPGLPRKARKCWAGGRPDTFVIIAALSSPYLYGQVRGWSVFSGLRPAGL